MSSNQKKVVLIAGGAGGIGTATAKTFAKDGFDVVVTDINLAGAKIVSRNLPNNGNQKHTALHMDVGKYQSVEDAFRYVYDNYKTAPTIVVNSSGFAKQSPLLEMSEELFTSVIEVNLNGTYRVTRIAAQHMIKAAVKDAVIVHITSIGSKLPFIFNCNYCAAKAGQEAIVKITGKELADHNIRVVSVSPGMVNTPMLNDMSDEDREAFIAGVPLKRFAEAQEVADAIQYMASSKCAYVTASEFEIGGGFTC